MGEGGGLGPLEVGIAGHHRVQVGLGLFHQHLLQVQDLLDDGGDLFFHIKASVHGHLVVPGAGGVQPLASVADALGQHGLDVHVDVLVVQRELHLAVLDVGQDGLQALDDLLGLVLLDDALLAQHGGVGDGAPDVLLIQPGVKADGGIKVVYQCVGLLLKPSSPKLHSIFYLSGVPTNIWYVGRNIKLRVETRGSPLSKSVYSRLTSACPGPAAPERCRAGPTG